MSITAEVGLEIAVIGAGGLGVTACLGLLAGWPSGLPLKLRIFDPDKVELSNLNRQILFGAEDLGRPKAAVLQSALMRLYGSASSSAIHVSAQQVAIDERTIGQLSRCSLVLDCCDSTATKFLINDYCVPRGVPFCYAGAVGTAGQLLLWYPAPGHCTGCLRCLYGDLTAEEHAQTAGSCRSAGILGPVVGYVGLWQAELALSLLGGDRSRCNKLLRFSYPRCALETIDLGADEKCRHGCAERTSTIVDLRDKSCPSTFLYTKFALERTAPGGVLEVHFGNKESVQNVHRTLSEEGYEPRMGGASPGGSWLLRVTKPSDAGPPGAPA